MGVCDSGRTRLHGRPGRNGGPRHGAAMPRQSAGRQARKVRERLLGYRAARAGVRRTCLTVAREGRVVQLELGSGRELLLSGPWDLEVRVGGRLAKRVGDWEEVCWVSDRHVDYLELEMELSQGVRVQRQMLLAHQDHFLLLADAVLGEPASARRAGGLE